MFEIPEGDVADRGRRFGAGEVAGNAVVDASLGAG
jgi:hypothetical protein